MKNKKLVLKSKWQTVLEVLGTLAFILIVTTVDSEWTVEYFVFLGIAIGVLVSCASIIRKFGDLTKYED
jgi:MFS superfamily sulfate permease-like transporter